ncbi:hypothetical protein JY419_01415 [Stenotrophomonas maltophilia]|nr:hypothetical protein [Stenotrophomonas maltophilia]
MSARRYMDAERVRFYADDVAADQPLNNVDAARKSDDRLQKMQVLAVSDISSMVGKAGRGTLLMGLASRPPAVVPTSTARYPVAPPSRVVATST